MCCNRLKKKQRMMWIYRQIPRERRREMGAVKRPTADRERRGKEKKKKKKGRKTGCWGEIIIMMG